MRRSVLLFLSCALLAGPAAWPAPSDQSAMAAIPGGTFQAFFALRDTKSGSEKLVPNLVKVKRFRLDRQAVTNAQFAAFVARRPEWRKSAVKAVFAEGGYLQHWRDDGSSGDPANAQAPVTNVSWFAAQAYCEDRGATLPTTDQWEYALYDKGRDQARVKEAALAWYSVPKTAPATKAALPPNHFGIRGLVGSVWEWTEDFGSALAGSEMREGGNKKTDLFCGGGSLGAKDASDYAAFMRYAFRASLKASYTLDNLGFRCAEVMS